MLKKVYACLLLAMSSLTLGYSNCYPVNDCKVNCNYNDCCFQDSCFDFCGFKPYIGLAGGVAPLSGYFQGQTAATGETHYVTTGGTAGLIGGVYGVQTNWDSFFFAIQANTLYNTTQRTVGKATTTTAPAVVNYDVEYRNHFQWGIDARLGWTLCGINPYVLGGFESGSWRLALSNNSTLSNLGIPAGSTVNTSKTLWGGKVGAGVTFPILGCLWANMEYSYTWFGRVSTTLTDAITGFSWNHRAEVRQNSILFGVNYLF